MLVSIFTQSTLANHLIPICNVIYNLHEKRTSKTSANDEVNSFNNIAPVTKSQQIRNLVKLILKKLIKKFSYEIVFEKVFDMENQRAVKKDSMIEESSEVVVHKLTSVIKLGLEHLFVNLKKSIEVEKKRKLDEVRNRSGKASANDDLVSMYTTKSAANGTNYNEVEDLLKESEDDEPTTQMDQKSQRTTKSNKSERSIKRAEKKATNRKLGHNSWIRENDNEDPLDLLDPMAIKNVFATKPLTKTQIQVKKDRDEANRSKNRGFSQGADGRLLIQDSEDEVDDTTSRKGKSKGKKPDELDDMMDTLSLSKRSMASKKSIKKRALEGEDSDEDDGQEMDKKSVSRSYRPGGSGIHRKLNGKREPIELGGEYKSKKSHGDIKKKNQPDPYAYIPLNMGKLNKRKKAKLQGEYKGIVRAVQKGASKGKKSTKKRLK